MHRFSNIKLTETEIESLLKVRRIPTQNRWYPTLVSEYEQELSYGIFQNLNATIRKNICYSLQYLEYIDLQLEELSFSESLYCMLYKNYIIIAAGIIESVFYHILKYHGKIKLQYFDKPKLTDVKTIKKDNKIFVQVEGLKERYEQPRESVQDFHFLIITVLQGNYLKIENTKRAKHYISYCKELRKRVHLHISQDAWTSDYHWFNHKEYILVRYILYRVLADPLFGRDNQKIFPSEETFSLNEIIRNKYIYNG